MSDNITNLQEDNTDVTIIESTDNDAAAVSTAEDTASNLDTSAEIINQQQSTIEALMKRTQVLTEQINTLLASGVQINDGNINATANEPDTLQDDYVTLSELGAQFGKR